MILFMLQLVAVTAEFLVGSIEGVAETGHIQKEFIGIILLPIVGNAAGTLLVDHYLLFVIDASFSQSTSPLSLYLLRISSTLVLELPSVQVS